ncbi:MAG: helix-turn-helix domain-containing protein [Chloroflexi bacterium]|nr:helix-turn-helix domain-containing protein [Chloroflexota bacterium]
MVRRTLTPTVDSGDSARWLTIQRASEMLGVSQATLRVWSAHGKLRTYITPGGHRRFLESELRGMVDQQETLPPNLSELLLASRERYEAVARKAVASSPWLRTFDDAARLTFRILGNSMLQLLTVYLVAGRRERERCLAQGREVAERYGAQAASLGLSLPQTTEAFLLFRNPVLETVTRWFREQPSARRGPEDVLRRVNTFMDEVLVKMSAAHEAAGRANA